MTINELIKKTRMQRGYSIAEFVKSLNISEDTVVSWEENNEKPLLSLLPSISDELKIPMQNLIVDNEILSSSTFVPRLLFIYFDLLNKEGNVYLSFAFSINKDNLTSKVIYDFLDEGVHKVFEYTLNEELTDIFIGATDKCQIINWREKEYGASLSNFYSFYNEKPYVNPEGFRYRCFIDMIKEISCKLLDEKYDNIVSSIDPNEPMYYHKGLNYETTKLTLEALDETKEFIERKKSKADELYWDMIG